MEHRDPYARVTGSSRQWVFRVPQVRGGRNRVGDSRHEVATPRTTRASNVGRRVAVGRSTRATLMRLLVGLARADISIRGTSNCWYTTASDNGALQPSL